tara:strand:+ start:207 stop:854 length:648 start_codon:yes stop_codon:yes gene_type:complete
MENEAYRQELKFIEKVVELNEFQLFLTMRDTRPADTYKEFRKTDKIGSGYVNRKKICEHLMTTFRQAYGVRGGKNDLDFFWFAINESGVGNRHFLKSDCGHLHIAIGWKKSSPFYENPAKHMDEFVLKIKGVSKKESADGKRVIGKFGWCDFCSSLANKDNQYLIQNKGAVANYMSKPEIGLINGGCFSKQPFPSPNLPHLPSDQDLRLEPLGAM